MEISVIITSYNEESYLAEAIESVVHQSQSPDEIVIVDANSDDKSPKIVEEYADRFPHLIRHFLLDYDCNIPEMRNFALEQVTGDLVTFLDGDDRFLEEKLEREYESLQNAADAKVAFSNVYHIDENGERMGVWAEEQPPSGFVLKECFSRNWPRRSLFRNELVYVDAIADVGFYDESLSMFEDWDLKTRLASQYNVVYCGTPLAEYRQHKAGISSRTGKSETLRQRKKVYEKNKRVVEANLPEQDYREANIEILKEHRRWKSEIELMENNRRGMAALEYCKYLIRYPEEILAWKTHLKYILPESIYWILVEVYERKAKYSNQ